MNYLEMVKRLVSELGVELPAKIDSVTNTPATAYGTTTEFVNKCVTWVAQAWLEIQEDQTNPPWNFMKEHGIFPLTAGQAKYEIPVQPNLGDYDGIVPYVAPIDLRYVWLVNDAHSPPLRTQVYYVAPEFYFGYYDRLNVVPGQSYRYTFDPDGCVLLDPPPGSDSLSLEFDYRRVVQELVADTDTPTGLPTKFHMLIVYRAMGYYSGFDESDPQYARSVKLERRMMNKLRIEQLPEYFMPGTR